VSGYPILTPQWWDQGWPRGFEGGPPVSGDPVFESGGWYFFWNETWSDMCGPYASEEEARTALHRYAESL
jgi:hypothetical protein